MSVKFCGSYCSRLSIRVFKLVLIVSLCTCFLLLCIKLLEFSISAIKDEELIVSAPQKTTESLQVVVETSTVEVTEPSVTPTTSSDVDEITALQQKIEYLLSDNFLSEWMQMLSESMYKLEGTPTEDLYEPGFSYPNAMLCPEMGNTLQVFIFITSAPDHRKERQSIRETWGTVANRSDVALGFIVGATHNRSLEYKLQQESLTKGDLIRINSIDSYKNLTLKSLSMLEWTLTYCPMTQFVLKTDDDMFLNMKLLLNFMEIHQEDTKTIFGRIAKRAKPHRNSNSKWYLPEDNYKNIMYPHFATGPIYLLTSDIVKDIYTTALTMPFIWLEDVFLTGFVAEELKIPREELGELGTSNRPKNKLMCHLEHLVAVHDVNITTQYDLWYNLNHPNTTHCTILEEKGSDDLNDALQSLMQQLQSLKFL